MARIWVTGSTDGIGLETARQLVAQGHEVVLHAGERAVTDDSIERIFQVNVVAPYLLTALMPRASRYVYLSSNQQANGTFHPDDLSFEDRPWDGREAYADSKLHDVMLAFAVARRWPTVISNAVDPGWIRTRMGGPSAPDDLPEGAETPVWLATSDEPEATASGRFLRRRQVLDPNPIAHDVDAQERLFTELAGLTDVELPQ
jgi:NAD(P)-dependent dehydrogenase (short-subunit alcohol dehydrogenase family)